LFERVQFLQRVLKDDSRRQRGFSERVLEIVFKWSSQTESSKKVLEESSYKKFLHKVLEELSNRETSKTVLKESFEESSKKLLLKDNC